MQTSSALYYPFSRCIDTALLKQMLLIFDSITFVDAVDDEYWRGHLFQNLERHDQRFSSYRDVTNCLPWLKQKEIVRIIAPHKLRSLNQDLTVAATLSDITDKTWTQAADPRRYNIPSEFIRGRQSPSWQIFQDKIPDKIVDALENEEQLSHHLLKKGTETYAWELSYAAGSAIGINVHLAAADELGLSPVTDSALHHELMLMKILRGKGNQPIIESDISLERITQRILFRILGDILPRSRLDDLSLEQIIQFRESTQALRTQFSSDVKAIAVSQVDFSKPGDFLIAEKRVSDALIKSSKQYNDDIAGVRDKLWPKIIDGVSGQVPVSATAAGLAASYISGSGYVLAASVALHALQPLKAALEWRADLKAKKRSASNAVAFLSRVARL